MLLKVSHVCYDCLTVLLQDDHEETAESAVVGFPHDIKGEGIEYLSILLILLFRLCLLGIYLILI